MVRVYDPVTLTSFAPDAVSVEGSFCGRAQAGASIRRERHGELEDQLRADLRSHRKVATLTEGTAVLARRGGSCSRSTR